jgi:1L-myo-inositol 1-phosphate cytidylyltransferase
MTSDTARRSAGTGRTGLILAAGLGSRHSPAGTPVPKPLLPVAGRELLLRTIDSLEVAGCRRVVVVLGHRSEEMERFLAERYFGPVELVSVLNRRFQLSNGVSVLSARNELPDHFLLAMADHVFDRKVMEIVAQSELPSQGAVVVVDRKLASILDMDDATKVACEGPLVRRIGKTLAQFDAVDCGVFLASTSLLDALQSVESRKGDASLSEGVQVLADRDQMRWIDLGDGWWQDVDTPEMLQAAESRLSAFVPRSQRPGTLATP